MPGPEAERASASGEEVPQNKVVRLLPDVLDEHRNIRRRSKKEEADHGG
jgi:hypothetical protein